MPSTPSRFTGGVSDYENGNAGIGQSYPTLDPARFARFFDDFNTFSLTDWVQTVVGTGTVNTAKQTGAHGGTLVLVNSAADDDAINLQQGGKAAGAVAAADQVAENFKFTSGKKAWLRARFKISDATQSDLLIGLAITDTSLTQSLPSDGVFFNKVDGGTILLANVRAGGTSSTITMTSSMANDTYYTCELYYDGNTTFHAYLNGVQVGGDLTSVANLTTEFLAVSMSVSNGEAVAKTMTVDWLDVVMER